MKFTRPTKNIFFFVYITSLVFLAISSIAKERPLTDYTVEFYTTSDGLPQSSVNNIAQTPDGYLWFGTYEGLARFDGIEYRVFDKENTPQFFNNGVKALIADKNGSLWIGTPNGLLRYRNRRFERFGIKDGLSGEFILSLYEDVKGNIWIGTTTGLNKYENGKFINLSPTSQVFTSYIYAISGDSLGRIWVGSGTHGLNFIDGLSFKHYGKDQGINTQNVRALLVDQKGNVWIGSGDKGLWIKMGNGFINLGNHFDFQTNDVRVIYSDDKGRIWLGTNNQGIYIWDKGYIIQPIKNKKYNALAIRSVFKDRDGSFWIGTRSGLIRLKRDIYVLHNKNNGLPVDQLRTVFSDRDGEIWLGTVGAGLLKKEGNNFKVALSPRVFPTGKVWSIAQSGDGAIWIGTYGNGVFRYKNGLYRTFNTSRGLAADVVRVVFVDSKDRIWIGTNGRGINVLDRGRILHYNTDTGLADNYIYSIAEDVKGNIWIGSYSGELTLFDGRDFSIYAPNPEIGRHAIWSIYPDSDGVLWLGTDNGGLKYFKNGEFFAFTTADGLYHDTAFQIVPDSLGYLWMNCNKGIYRVKKSDLLDYRDGKISTLKCLSLGKDDGIIVTESSGPAQPTACMTKEGTIWFATVDGAVVIDPEDLGSNRQPPSIVIEHMKVKDHIFHPNGDIVLEPDERNIEIKYTGLSFVLPQKLQFKYQLVGYDDIPVDAGTRRTAFYTGLPPGKYTFSVMAGNELGVWGEDSATITLEVLPYFWETIWFKTFAVLLIILLPVFGYRYRIKKIRARAVNLERQVAIRVKELAEKNEELLNSNSKLNRANHKLEFLAQNDALTQIANRRYFVDVYEREWKLALRTKQALSTIMIDIDNFKLYNDNYGHLSGDECLKDVARKLQHELRRPTDLVARFGGEEFVVILPNTESEGSIETAERLRKAIYDLKIPHEFSPVDKWVTISVGSCSTVPSKEYRINSLIKRSDDALYLAKERGKNRIECLDFAIPSKTKKKKK